MNKIYRRSTLVKNTKPKKKNEKNRKRNVIVNFRVSPVEKELIDKRIELSGLMKSEFFIQSCLYQKIHVTGNIKTFDAIRKSVEEVDKHLREIQRVEELELEKLESLRTVVEILNKLFGSEE